MKKCLEPEIILKEKANARYLKIMVKNHGEIGETFPGAGHKAWLFVGEISVL